MGPCVSTGDVSGVMRQGRNRSKGGVWWTLVAATTLSVQLERLADSLGACRCCQANGGMADMAICRHALHVARGATAAGVGQAAGKNPGGHESSAQCSELSGSSLHTPHDTQQAKSGQSQKSSRLAVLIKRLSRRL